MVKDEKFEGHESDRVVKGVSEAMVALRESFCFKHLSKDHGYLGDLTACEIGLSFDKLSLQSLEGISDDFSK